MLGPLFASCTGMVDEMFVALITGRTEVEPIGYIVVLVCFTAVISSLSRLDQPDLGSVRGSFITQIKIWMSRVKLTYQYLLNNQLKLFA